MYIGVSGIDGSGKSTLINIINKFIGSTLKRKASLCDAMKPGCYNIELKNVETIFGRKKYYDDFFSPEIINLAFCADLYENYHNIIEPNINEGNVVISHRSRLCCRVYSEVFSDKLSIVEALIESVPFPDLLFYLKTSPDVAIRRVQGRQVKEGIPIVRKENIQVFEKAIKLYDTQILKSNSNIITINGDMRIDIIEKEVKEILQTYFETVSKFV